jgi:sterol desaturase/sphingolipid hydroxylase (fatty acid hydroxylase superfamily)
MSTLWTQYQDWWAQWGLQSNWLALSLPVVWSAILAEAAWGALRGRRVYHLRHAVGDVSTYAAHYAIEVAGYVLIVGAAHGWTWQHRLFTIPDTAWSWAALWVLNDFVYYVFHRLHHRIGWLWCAHSVHHSVEHLNLLASYRKSPFYQLGFGWTLWLPLTWLGFNPYSTAYLYGLNLTIQVLLHTNAVPKLGWIEAIFNTPSHHRVHHARNPRYLDRNYGGVFIVWDRVFGTYAEECSSEPCQYGLVSPPRSHDPVTLSFFPWVRLAREVLRPGPLGERLKPLWAPPEWRRADSPGGLKATRA